jgi:hypothetical protein
MSEDQAVAQDSAAADPAAPARETERRGMHRNQADGLRAMFGRAEPVVVCVASALPADATVTLGLGTAHALSGRGHLSLLVDEVPLSERQSHQGFAYPVRYDLGQVFSGVVALNRVLRRVDEKLWFTTGVKVRAAVDGKRARGPSLVTMLQQTELDFEFVVIATCEPFGSSMRCYGEAVHRLVVAAPDAASLSRALAHVRELSMTSGGSPVPVLMLGGADESAGRVAYERLDAASQQQLEQPLQWLGWVRTAEASALSSDPDDGLSLPISVYQMLAGHVLAQG